MAEPFGILLENPRRGRGGRFVKGGRRRRRSARRRRASSRRRRRSSRRRRRNPSIVGATIPNPRRRRSRRRRSRSRSRRRSYRRNPFAIGKLGGGNIKRTLFAGLGLAGGEVLGDMLARAASKFGVGKLLDVVKVPAPVRVPALRILVGLFATPLLRMAKFLPAGVVSSFGAVNVASGVLAMTAAMRQNTFAKIGLADYELADYELADYELAGMGDVLVGTEDDGMGDVLVGFDDGIGGDYSDQDFYGGYERMT